jgi:hypothetical protein
VKVDEGVANHTDPLSCVAHREVSGEALVGESIGQPLNRESRFNPGCRRRIGHGRQQLDTFHFFVSELWQRTLRRRSQMDGMTWERIMRLANDWLPNPHILHPWPQARFAAKHRGASRMRETRSYGSVRGALSNELAYRELVRACSSRADDLSPTWRAPFRWRPWPASIAGGAGVRPDHPLSDTSRTSITALRRVLFAERKIWNP